MAIFDWRPSYGTALDYEPKILKSPFGDGYAQRLRNGINHNMKKWSLVFLGREDTERDAIVQFLVDHGGVTSFTWLDAEGELLQYICESWRSSYDDFDGNTINCTFEQVPEYLALAVGLILTSPTGQVLTSPTGETLEAPA